MIDFNLSAECSVISIPLDRPLPELSLPISFTLTWMLGSGVYAWRTERYKKHDHLEVRTTPICKPKHLGFNPSTPLQKLHDAGYFPESLERHELRVVTGKSYEAKDGQNKITSLTPTEDSTTLVAHDYPMEKEIHEIAMLMAEDTVGYFYSGATAVEMRLSKKLSQVWFNIGFAGRSGMRDWMAFISQHNYDANKTVASLK